MSVPDADFEQLFREHHDAVHRFASRRVPAEAVQDVVSDTFLTAWRRRSEIDGDPRPWLLGVARRSAANRLRGDARRAALSERIAAERAAEPPLAAAAGGSALLAALQTLSERDREALMLVAWDGLEHRHAARVVGCSTTAFTVRVYRARTRLRRALASRDDPSPTTEMRHVQ